MTPGNSLHQTLDEEKTVEVILYIAHHFDDLYMLLKTLYYADQDHLSNYGRLITGDRYFALEQGAVPSGAYDMIKFVRGDKQFPFDEKVKLAFGVEDKIHIVPKRKPDLDYISDSEIEILDKAIAESIEIGWSGLWKKSHNQNQRNVIGKLLE